MRSIGFGNRRAITFLAPTLFVLSAAVFAGCGGGGGGGGMAAETAGRAAAISVVGMNFGAPITVSSGTVVTWNNNSGLPHNIVWDSFSPTSSPGPGPNIGTFEPATSVSWTAPKETVATTYQYHCGIHGPMMSSAITVTP